MDQATITALPDERLEAELCQLAADLTAGTARWFQLIAEYDRRQVWAHWESRSMAHWLSHHIGISLITARQYVHVATTLTHYPLLHTTFAAGRLSYSRVRALCRVITPTSETDLVAMALHATAPQLDRFVAGVQRARKLNAPSDHETQHANRQLHLTQDDDGTWILQARLPAETGTLLQRALSAELDRQPAPSDGQPRQPIAQQRVDALVTLIQHGHATRDADNGVVPARPLVVIHRHTDGDELEHGPAITPAHADHLSQDADHMQATHHGPSSSGSEPRIVYGRRRRSPTRTMRRFLHERDHGCRFPACTNRRNLHSHHITHYGHDGLTTHTNLVMLCTHHHQALHRDGWTITIDPDGHITFTKPGMRPPPNVPAADIEHVVAQFTHPFQPGTTGERMDLHLAVQAFLHNESLHNARLTSEQHAHDSAESPSGP